MSAIIDPHSLGPSLAKKLLAEQHHSHKRSASDVELVQLSTHTIQLAWSPAEELHGQFGVFNRSASNKQVAIKIKTTHPNIYRVRPATAIIEPGSSVFVKVVRTATKTIKEADPEGHRFVIVCVPVKFGNEGGSDEPDAPFTAKLKVKVAPRSSAWPVNNDELSRLALQVERKLREVLVLDGPERQTDILVQFTVYLLARGQLHVNQLNDIKALIAQLCDPKKLEEEYWRSRSRAGSRQHSRADSLMHPDDAASVGSIDSGRREKTPKPKKVSTSKKEGSASQQEVGSNNSREGKNQLIEQFLCVNPMFEPSFAEKNANLSPGGSKSGSPGHSKGKGPPQGAAKSPDHARGVSGISETWEYGSTGAPSPCNGQRSSTPSTKPAVPSRLSVQSLPTATKPKPKRRGLGGRKGMFSDDLSDLSFDSESEYGEEDSWEDEQDTTREDLAEMLAQPSNAPAKKAAPAPASDSGTPKAKPTKQTTFQDPPVSGEVPPVKEKQPKAVKEEGEPSGAKDTEDYKLGKHSRSNSNPSTFGTSSYGATPMQMRSKDSSKGDKGDKGGWGKRLLSKS